jgi:uncharacterized protein YjiS (DUF1127 family)
MAYVQPQPKSTSSVFENLVMVVRNVIQRYKQYRLYCKTVSELRALNGRELSDLGLSRSMIESVAFTAVYEGFNKRTSFL